MWRTIGNTRLLCAVAFTTLAATTAAIAQTTANYPSKPVRMIVPFAPGGASTTISRTFAERLGQEFGTSFVVEHRPRGSRRVHIAGGP